MEDYLVTILFGTFLVLLLIGAPITVSLAVAALASYLVLGEDPVAMVQIAYTSVGSFPLMALPAFVLAGALMEAAGISRRLVDVAEALAGPVTGGLGMTTVLACLFFGAISGSGPATTAAVGMLMIPAMTRRGYDKSYAGAVTAASGGIGIIIPPSIPMVIFGVSAMGLPVPPEALEKYGEFSSVSIPKLFVAGILPGLLTAVGLIVMNYILSRRHGYKGLTDRWSLAELGTAIRRGFWSLLAPCVILGGIYSGVFTPTESAVVAIAYTMLVGVVMHRELTLAKLRDALRATTWITGRVLLILFAATVFGRLLVEQEIPAVLAESLLGLTDSLSVIWLILIVMLLFIGMFMETLAAIMILVPVLMPIMYMLGADPTHVGIVIICALSIGFQTPPLGENLFVASGISGMKVEQIVVKVLPFTLACVLVLLLIAFVPQLATWLPTLAGY
ncbi:MAG: TRAP transporter large permease [Lautropia sp.]|nr:TRAP transporter large permease [Lautropia sp.]